MPLRTSLARAALNTGNVLAVTVAAAGALLMVWAVVDAVFSLIGVALIGLILLALGAGLYVLLNRESIAVSIEEARKAVRNEGERC